MECVCVNPTQSIRNGENTILTIFVYSNVPRRIQNHREIIWEKISKSKTIERFLSIFFRNISSWQKEATNFFVSDFGTISECLSHAIKIQIRNFYFVQLKR